jgi:hypothetical protein
MDGPASRVAGPGAQGSVGSAPCSSIATMLPVQFDNNKRCNSWDVPMPVKFAEAGGGSAGARSVTLTYSGTIALSSSLPTITSIASVAVVAGHSLVRFLPRSPPRRAREAVQIQSQRPRTRYKHTCFG